MRNKKEQEGVDSRTQDDHEKDETRGKQLFRIYSYLVAAWFIIYFFLHWLMPAEIQQPVGLEASITRAESIISVRTVDVSKIQELPNAENLSLTGSAATRLNDAYKKLEAAALTNQKAQFNAELATLRTEVAKTEGVNADKVLFLIDKMEEENKADEPNSGVLKVYLRDVKGEVSKIAGWYFWSTGWLKWLELFLWAALGTFFYALWQIQRWLRTKPVGEFQKEIFWYVTMTMRGPFVALLLIFALSTVKLDVVNIGFDLTTMPIHVWIFLAGVLGIFSYMAYEELSIIVKAIFPKAWALASDSPSILPSAQDVPFGDNTLFSVFPKDIVKWDILPEDMGSIDSGGKYTAPPKKDAVLGAVTGAKVTVRATLKEEPSIVDTAKVTLYEKFDVTGDKEVVFDTKHQYDTQPKQDEITWSSDMGRISEEGMYASPKEGAEGAEVTITATLKKVPAVSSSIKVKLVKPPG